MISTIHQFWLEQQFYEVTKKMPEGRKSRHFICICSVQQEQRRGDKVKIRPSIFFKKLFVFPVQDVFLNQMFHKGFHMEADILQHIFRLLCPQISIFFYSRSFYLNIFCPDLLLLFVYQMASMPEQKNLLRSSVRKKVFAQISYRSQR